MVGGSGVSCVDTATLGVSSSRFRGWFSGPSGAAPPEQAKQNSEMATSVTHSAVNLPPTVRSQCGTFAASLGGFLRHSVESLEHQSASTGGTDTGKPMGASPGHSSHRLARFKWASYRRVDADPVLLSPGPGCIWQFPTNHSTPYPRGALRFLDNQPAGDDNINS